MQVLTLEVVIVVQWQLRPLNLNETSGKAFPTKTSLV